MSMTSKLKLLLRTMLVVSTILLFVCCPEKASCLTVIVIFFLLAYLNIIMFSFRRNANMAIASAKSTEMKFKSNIILEDAIIEEERKMRFKLEKEEYYAESAKSRPECS